MQTQQGYANPQKSISLSNIWTPQVVILHPQMLKWLNLGTIIHGLHPCPKRRTKRPSFFSNSNSRARRIKERWGTARSAVAFPPHNQHLTNKQTVRIDKSRTFYNSNDPFFNNDLLLHLIL